MEGSGTRKASIQHHLCWKIGNGEGILVFSDPWFPGWDQYRANSASQSQLRVSSLIDQNSNNWDFQPLLENFGLFHQALSIATNRQIAPGIAGIPDTLLFTFAKNGTFSVKKAYQLIKGDVGSAADKSFWEGIWGERGLLPKLKLLIWRGVHNALPVRGVLGARISSISVLCPLCLTEPETVEHSLFGCQFARMAWWASPLNI